MQNWRTQARQTVLQAGNGRFLKVEYHTVELPDGQVIEEWPWLITPDFVNVVAETAAGEYICFRQTKYAVEGVSLAVTGGYLEPGEDPLTAAQRELLEETGYVAAEWIDLGKYAVDGNRGAGTAHLFLARGAEWRQPIDADDLEEQELLLLTRAEMRAALQRGEFKVLPWATAVALALCRQDGG
ncbi:MAG: NUDIX hydrolase [Chloroflexota bacterium]|nr:NUDIX hydrolase [Chloroflexota bacterium]